MAKKQTGTTDKKRTKSKATKRTKISWIAKPDGMSLTEWQIALRKQIAQEEHFGISCVDDKLLPGEYRVKSPKTKQEYKVVYRGAKSEWNYCSCFDFKTAQLGTCKHIEAVKLWIGSNRRARVHQEIPPYTSVYLRYLPAEDAAGEKGDARKVCIRIGSDHQEEYEQLATQYFDRNGVMRMPIKKWRNSPSRPLPSAILSGSIRMPSTSSLTSARRSSASISCIAILTKC